MYTAGKWEAFLDAIRNIYNDAFKTRKLSASNSKKYSSMSIIGLNMDNGLNTN